MKFLLDTHTYLWSMMEPRRLPAKVLSALREPGNEFFLSMASLWEMTIKSSKGSLELPFPTIEDVLRDLEFSPIQVLAVHGSDLVVLERMQHADHKGPV